MKTPNYVNNFHVTSINTEAAWESISGMTSRSYLPTGADSAYGLQPPYDYTIPNGTGNVALKVGGYRDSVYSLYYAPGDKPLYAPLDIDWPSAMLLNTGSLNVTTGLYGRDTVNLPFTSGVSYSFSLQTLVTDTNGDKHMTAAIYCHRP